jgi:hypothetical protein
LEFINNIIGRNIRQKIKIQNCFPAGEFISNKETVTSEKVVE